MPKRILVVEDEEDNLTLFIHILQRMLGHTVFIAHDGHEAIQAAQANNPDIILMDLTLPKLTGWEATRSLKGLEQFRNTPIIALTAHAMSGDRERALEAGCDSYFAKPIDLDSFLKFLTPYLEEDTPTSAPVSETPSTPQPASSSAEKETTSPAESGSTMPQEDKPAATTEQPPTSEPAAPRSEPSTTKPTDTKAEAHLHSSTTKQPEASAKGEPA